MGRPGAPRVTVHVAASLDGRIAAGRETTRLSTAEGRRSAHLARAESDAVLVGSETVRIDDPLLTVREVALLPRRPPLRVVLASTLDVPHQAKLFGETLAGTPVLVLGARGRASKAAEEALRSRGVDTALVAPDENGMVALGPALELLAARGISRLLVEGGSRVLTSFFRARLVDAVEVELAMTMLGAPGTPLVGVLDEAPELTDIEVTRLGANVLVRGNVVKR